MAARNLTLAIVAPWLRGTEVQVSAAPRKGPLRQCTRWHQGAIVTKKPGNFGWTPTTVLVDSFTIKGISMVITNGRHITRGTDDYDLTEPYRHVASVP
jgi:hypothetical protein